MNILEKTLAKLRKMHPYWHKWELLAIKEKDELLAKEVGKKLYENDTTHQPACHQTEQEDQKEKPSDNCQNL